MNKEFFSQPPVYANIIRPNLSNLPKERCPEEVHNWLEYDRHLETPSVPVRHKGSGGTAPLENKGVPCTPCDLKVVSTNRDTSATGAPPQEPGVVTEASRHKRLTADV